METAITYSYIPLDSSVIHYCFRPFSNILAAEEVQNAPMNVPRAMFFTIFINGAMGFTMYLVILFCMGDVEQALGTPTGFPFIEIFRNATQSKTAATVLTSVLITMYICATFNFMASASRQAWAFARDGGLPFSNLFKQVFVLP